MFFNTLESQLLSQLAVRKIEGDKDLIGVTAYTDAARFWRDVSRVPSLVSKPLTLDTLTGLTRNPYEANMFQLV